MNNIPIEQTEFAEYCFGRFLRQLALAQQNQNELLAQTVTIIPELSSQEGVDAKNITPDIWEKRVASTIVAHYRAEYVPGKLRAAS